jgi:hypothetical protein
MSENSETNMKKIFSTIDIKKEIGNMPGTFIQFGAVFFIGFITGKLYTYGFNIPEKMDSSFFGMPGEINGAYLLISFLMVGVLALSDFVGGIIRGVMDYFRGNNKVHE